MQVTDVSLVLKDSDMDSVWSISLRLFEVGIPNLVCQCIHGTANFPVSFSGHCDLAL